MTGRVCVGAVAGAFGTGGEVRLKSFCAEPGAIAAYGPLTAEDGATSWEVRLTGAVNGGVSARLSGVTTREAAAALKGTRLYAPREALPAPEEDEFYHADLVGLEMRDTGGALLGRIGAVLNHGATDLLEVRPETGGETVLVPFTAEIVPTVDIAAGRVVADPPEGLF